MGLFKSDPPEKMIAALTEAIVPMAQDAWDRGQKYFSPVLMQNWSNLKTPIVHGATVVRWDAQLEAIESVGWRLHSWNVGLPSEAGMGVVHAYPLFERVSSERL